jgi:hypothetical protein
VHHGEAAITIAAQIGGALVGEEAWIEVELRGTLTKATVYLRGGSVSSVWDVNSRREVEDVAAHYAIARSQISYADGSFDEPLQAS